MQSEVNQKEKNKYYILKHLCGMWGKWYQQSYLQSRNTDTDVENKCVDTTEDRGGRMNWEVRVGL